MNTWICLLRGIGGKYTLPSAIFVAVLESLKLKDVKTCIATGNAVFRSRVTRREVLAKKISDAINDERGFAPRVLLLTLEELADAIAKNPYPHAGSAPTTLHLFFLPGPPTAADFEKLENLKANGEEFALRDHVFYLHVPKGFSGSKLAPQVEKRLGGWATARNWRSACRILDLAKSIGE